MRLVYDSGALIAAERGSADLLALQRWAHRTSGPPMVPAAVLGQVWRGTARQPRISRLLAGCLVVPLDAAAAREGGVLCGMAGTSDIVDAVVATLAARCDAGIV